MKECSFCGKQNNEVKKLIKGDNVAICSECVTLCNNIIAKDPVIESTTKIVDINPLELKEFLDKHVISQNNAKEILSVAVANHYKRINIGENKIEKSNILMLGPSGSGKTILSKTIAKFVDVPFVTTDATLLTEAGYVGNDVDSLLFEMLQVAKGDVKLAETGIIFIDEIDKIAKKGTSSTSHDVSGEGVQQALLKLVEGAKYTIGWKGEPVEIDTGNILFIASGAFVNLEGIRKNKQKHCKIGFAAELDKKLTEDVDCEDLIKYGLIPEFVGRFPVIAEVQDLTKSDMLEILNTVENNLLGQYKTLFEYNNVKIQFEKEALNTVVNIALDRKTGARGLKAILEKSLLPHMFNVNKYSENNTNIVMSEDLILNPKALKYKEM